MTKELEAFKLIKSKLLLLLDFEDEDYDEAEEALKEVEHIILLEALERKTLESIKEKGVNLYKLKMCDSVEEYNKLCNNALPLTQKEYDLFINVLL